MKYITTQQSELILKGLKRLPKKIQESNSENLEFLNFWLAEKIKDKANIVIYDRNGKRP